MHFSMLDFASTVADSTVFFFLGVLLSLTNLFLSRCGRGSSGFGSGGSEIIYKSTQNSTNQYRNHCFENLSNKPVSSSVLFACFLFGFDEELIVNVVSVT